jgi:hypothetical protein
MPELLANLAELAMILDRMTRPAEGLDDTQDETGEIRENYEPISGITYI